MKNFKLFEGINFILKNKNRKLYNLEHKLIIYFNNKTNKIEIINNKNELMQFIFNDKTIEEYWTTEGRQKYCFRLYKDDNLIKVITQYCFENEVQITEHFLTLKYKTTKIKHEIIKEVL